MTCLRHALVATALALGTLPPVARAADEAPRPCDRTNWLGQRTQPGPDYAGSRDALLDQMAMVPDTAAGRAGAPMLSYADFDAMVAAGMHKVTPGADLGSVPLDDALSALQRANAGPHQYLLAIGVGRDAMAEAIGVGPTDIRRGLDFGMPPNVGMVLGLEPGGADADAVGSALAARGFDERAVDGVTVWHRLEDNAIDVPGRVPEDPFWGMLGRSARIFVHEEALAGAPAWAMAAAMVAAAIGQAPALVNDPAMCALALAVTDPSLSGNLLQFMLLAPTDMMFAQPQLVPPQSGEGPGLELVAPAEQPGTLPPYRMIALADRFDGGRDEALIALAYRDADKAAIAAEVLAERMRAFRPHTAPDTWQRLLADFNAEITGRVIAPAGEGPAVALVSIRYDSRYPTDETTDGLRVQGGRLFALLAQAIYARELTPLIVDAE